MRAAAALAIALMMGATAPSVDAQVTRLRDMSFGTILSGTTTTVSKTSANAAQWRIRGLLGIGGGFQLTLPTTLSGPGGSTLSVTFSASDATYRVGTNNPSGGTSFNPQNFVSLVLVVLSDIYVWLGASVSPPINQPPGAYSGTVVLTTVGLL